MIFIQDYGSISQIFCHNLFILYKMKEFHELYILTGEEKRSINKLTGQFIMTG
ncbi:hypothetical protein M2651_11205 [Clostridium sp. SYSU_GA19001]|uniref:hypothetical protein n=1 Tax=Clostridium caldaquaticum TaxID=2940653 RepID=UPI0020773419|nr:hypothetical protein [Clostridium caldaquaticum]MCM8711581.1 hypothetical protein [Clostridium caldaquaticum]